MTKTDKFTLALQFVGILGGGAGIYGIFTENMTLTVTGLVLAFLFSFCKPGKIELHIIARLGMGITFTVIGMLLTHLIGSVPWGLSLLYSAVFVYTIQSVSWTVLRFLKYI